MSKQRKSQTFKQFDVFRYQSVKNVIDSGDKVGRLTKRFVIKTCQFRFMLKHHKSLPNLYSSAGGKMEKEVLVFRRRYQNESATSD